MFTFYMEGVVELTMGAMICVTMVTLDNFSSFQETLHTCCAFLALVCGVTIPISLIVAARRHFSTLELGYEHTN